ncbi:MAG TPA: tetratricopeptide repeat protein, partial [Gemmatimonadaceae bacterium]
ASRALRQQLGESMRDLRDMLPLERATTASLPALRKYSEAYWAGINGDRPQAIRLFVEAVALDTGFALAYSGISTSYAAMAEPGRALEFRQRALQHVDRLPFRERGLQLAQAAHARNDYQRTIQEYTRLLERYPTDVAFLNNLALAYRDIRQYAEAEKLWNRAIALDSGINVLYYGLHNALVGQNKLPESRAILDIIRRRSPQDALLPVISVQQAAVEQDWDEAWKLAVVNRDRLEGDTLGLVDAYEQLGSIAMLHGRLSDAERHWRTQILLSTKTESYGRRLFGAMQLGYLELRYNKQPARARAIVDSVIRLKPLGEVLPADRSYEALSRFYAEAGDIPKARQMLDAADSNNKAIDRLMAGEMAWSRGEIALYSGDVKTAVSELKAASTTAWCAFCVLPSLARAYEAAGKPDLALATYREYMSTPWLWRYENDAIEVGRVLRRMGELYEAAGQQTEANRAWNQLSVLWRNADGLAALEVAAVRKLIKQ